MKAKDILRSDEFEEKAQVRLDAKNRISVGKLSAEILTDSYKVFTNSQGQILLEPMVSVPAYESWVHTDLTAAKSIKRGLKQSAEGQIVKRRSYTSEAED